LGIYKNQALFLNKMKPLLIIFFLAYTETMKLGDAATEQMVLLRSDIGPMRCTENSVNIKSVEKNEVYTYDYEWIVSADCTNKTSVAPIEMKSIGPQDFKFFFKKQVDEFGRWLVMEIYTDDQIEPEDDYPCKSMDFNCKEVVDGRVETDYEMHNQLFSADFVTTFRLAKWPEYYYWSSTLSCRFEMEFVSQGFCS
jgi:hypothetical protein